MAKIERQFRVANKHGIHARPAAMFVQMIDRFAVTVTVAKGAERVNGKSIMGLLMLGAQCESLLTLTVEGDNAEAAMVAFEDFFSKQEEDLVK